MELGHRVIPRLEAAPDFLKVTLAFFLQLRAIRSRNAQYSASLSALRCSSSCCASKGKPSGPKNYKTQKSDLKIKHDLALLG